MWLKLLHKMQKTASDIRFDTNQLRRDRGPGAPVFIFGLWRSISLTEHATRHDRNDEITNCGGIRLRVSLVERAVARLRASFRSETHALLSSAVGQRRPTDRRLRATRRCHLKMVWRAFLDGSRQLGACNAVSTPAFSVIQRECLFPPSVGRSI